MAAYGALMGVRDHRGSGVGAGAPADLDALPPPDVLQALVDVLADVVEEPTPPGVHDGPIDHDRDHDR